MAIDLDALVLGPIMDVWGVPVTYRPGAGPPQQISGVFSDAFTEVRFENGTPMQSTHTVLGIRAAAVSGPPPVPGEMVQVGGVDYVINEALPDGEGHLKLYLQLV